MEKLVSVAVFAYAQFLPGLSTEFELIVRNEFVCLFSAVQGYVQLSSGVFHRQCDVSDVLITASELCNCIRR